MFNFFKKVLVISNWGTGKELLDASIQRVGGFSGFFGGLSKNWFPQACSEPLCFLSCGGPVCTFFRPIVHLGTSTPRFGYSFAFWSRSLFLATVSHSGAGVFVLAPISHLARVSRAAPKILCRRPRLSLRAFSLAAQVAHARQDTRLPLRARLLRRLVCFVRSFVGRCVCVCCLSSVSADGFPEACSDPLCFLICGGPVSYPDLLQEAGWPPEGTTEANAPPLKF